MTPRKGKTKARKAARPVHSISVRVEDASWRKDAAALRLLRRAVRLALQTAKPASGRLALTVLLTSDKAVRALNAQFRSKNKPTNVLSFPSSEDGAYLGDIAIAHGTVAREAKAQKKRFAAHAAHLAAHGVLHLLGHDHMTTAEAAVMESLEVRILEKLGIDDPYTLRPYKKARKALH